MKSHFLDFTDSEQNFEQSSSLKKEINFIFVLLALLKRPWVLLLTFAIVMIPLLYYLFSQVPTYRSSANVMVAVSGTSIIDELVASGGNRNNAKSVAYYTSILESREYKKAILQNILQSYPHISPDSASKLIRIEFERAAKSEGFITLFATSVNREFALVLAETAIECFRERSIELERQDAQNILEFVDSQLDVLTNKMQLAEEDLQSFLKKNEFNAAAAETGIGQELFEMEKKFSESQANLSMIKMNIDSYDNQIKELFNKMYKHPNEGVSIESEALTDRLNEIRNSLDNAAAEGLSETEIEVLRQQRNRILSDIMNTYSANDVNDITDDGYTGITLYNLEKELENALLDEEKYKNQVNFYNIQIENFKIQHPNISKNIIEYARLVRARDVIQKTVDILLEKREEARIKVASEQGGIKVIDKPSLPVRPISQKKTQKIIIGVLFSIAFGLIVCVVIDYFDDAIVGEDEVLKMGYQTFGTIPVLSPTKASKLSPLPMAKDKSGIHRSSMLLSEYSEKSPIAEAYRSIKTSLEFLSKDQNKKIFIISSPSSGEGKSLTTINLAISFAQGGNKVLVVDCDLRRSTQHKYLDLPRKPGLTNYFFEEAEYDEIFRDTFQENMHLVTAGTSPPNPAELLSSRKMKEFLSAVESKYDIILIDTPPIMACVDSRILANVGDGMVLIAKVESTSLKALYHSIEVAKKLNVNILGVILNQTEYRFGYGYYYAYRYYNPYNYYYSNYNYYYYTVEDKDGDKDKDKDKKEV